MSTLTVMGMVRATIIVRERNKNHVLNPLRRRSRRKTMKSAIERRNKERKRIRVRMVMTLTMLKRIWQRLLPVRRNPIRLGL